LQETKVNQQVELVARAIYQAKHKVSLWENEPANLKEHFRQCARNAINLLGDDIGILLLALEGSIAEPG
jgi:hypothetical protein